VTRFSLFWPGAILALSGIFLAIPASSQARPCGPRENVVARLAEGYGESRRSIGLGSNNQVVEVFASDASGTWTITVTSPSGVTCLVASGVAYEALREPLPAPGEDG